MAHDCRAGRAVTRSAASAAASSIGPLALLGSVAQPRRRPTPLPASTWCSTWPASRWAKVAGRPPRSGADSRQPGDRHAQSRERNAGARRAAARSGRGFGDRLLRLARDEVLDESSPPASDFLAEVCREWEAEARAAEQLGVAWCRRAFGIVLGEGAHWRRCCFLSSWASVDGWAVAGSGCRGLHIDDVVGILWPRRESDQYRGPVNAVSPDPVTNREFTRVLAGVLHRPASSPCRLWRAYWPWGGFSKYCSVRNAYCRKVAQRAGYDFRYPSLADALRAASSIDRLMNRCRPRCLDSQQATGSAMTAVFRC